MRKAAGFFYFVAIILGITELVHEFINGVINFGAIMLGSTFFIAASILFVGGALIEYFDECRKKDGKAPVNED